jgi:fructosamine-3-kinase
MNPSTAATPHGDCARIAAVLGAALGTTLHPQPTARIHGGSINACYRWDGAAGPIFVKVASIDQRAAFEAEAAGLEELALAGALKTPRVLCVGSDAASSWIALEWLAFGPRSADTLRLLGERLAGVHRRRAEVFGWRRDNTIGSTPQRNDPSGDWVTFLRDRRLGFQLALAASHGHGGRLQQRGAALLDHLGEFFTTYHPLPSLLHGDLWGGNWAGDARGEPVLFDPAVYYGDREADLAMTRLFGGFGVEFYAAYEAAWALDPGAPGRVALYNLYHVLNHLNLFGDGYRAQAVSLIDRALAELGH